MTAKQPVQFFILCTSLYLLLGTVTEAVRGPNAKPELSLKLETLKIPRRTLRIGVVAPLFETVPPKQNTGLVEERTARIVYELVEELVNRGHEVTLFAPHGSQTSAKLVSHEDYPAIGKQRAIPGFWNNRYLWMFEQIREQYEDLDLIHYHCIEHFAHMDKFIEKALTTLHEQPGGGTLDDLAPIAHLFPKAHVVVTPDYYEEAVKRWPKLAGQVPVKGLSAEEMADEYEKIYAKIVPELLEKKNKLANGYRIGFKNGYRNGFNGISAETGFPSPNRFVEEQRHSSASKNWSAEKTPNVYYSPRSHRFRQLRIAIVSPPILDVLPPKKGGGTERMVYFLAAELNKRGHHVTLFAPIGTKTRAHLLPIPYRTDPWAGKGNWAHHMLPVIFSQEFVKRTAHQFDIVHFHDTDHYVLMREFLKCTVTTRHMPINDATFFKMFSHVPLVSISDEQRKHVPEGLSMNWIKTVHNGIPVDNFVFAPQLDKSQEPYLAWMGRMTPVKGVEVAIAYAVRAGIKLKIAAQIVDEHREWWEDTVVPQIEQHHALVEYIGEVGAEKGEFLANALAFMFTPMWDEPFGLSLVEAMATGTPAIASRRGAVPEIVDEGITGFMFDYDENAENKNEEIDRLVGMGLIEKVATLDRAVIRATVKRRWSLEQMAFNYEKVYHEVLATKC